MFKKFATATAVFAGAIGLSACAVDATIVSKNLSTAADMFEVNRRIVFYNGITDKYILTVEGLCSIETGGQGGKLDVICKTGPSDYKKHFLGLSDNVTFFAEQLDARKTSAYHYRVVFKPQSILPDIDLKVSGKDFKIDE